MQKTQRLISVDESKYFQHAGQLHISPRKSEPASTLVTAIVGIAFAAMVILWALSAFAQSSPAAPAPSLVAWEQRAMELSATGLLALLGWLVTKANAYFSAHAKSSLAQYGAGVFDRLSAAALTAASAVEQMAARDLASGLTKANAAQLKADALALLKSQLGPAGLAELASIVGLDQVAEVLSTHVEAAVLQVNQAQAAAPLATPAKS